MKVLYTIFEQTVLFMPLALGAYIDIALMRLPDLSLESAYTFGAIMAVITLPLVQTLSQPVALLCLIGVSFFGGALVGFVSSFLTCRLRLPHLLSSIVTIGIFYGINFMVLGASNRSISYLPNMLSLPILKQFPELPLLFLSALLLTGLIFFLLKTPLGYSYMIYGQNTHFFDYHKISSSFVFMSGVILSNGLAGIAGYFFAQANGFVDISMGFGVPLLAILGLLLGKFLLQNKHLAITFLGFIFYFTLQQLLLKVGFNLKYFPIVQSLLIVIILMAGERQKNTQNHLGI